MSAYSPSWSQSVKMLVDESAALDLCYVTIGRLDGFWELKLKPWDVAAGGLIVNEAGGGVGVVRKQVRYPCRRDPRE